MAPPRGAPLVCTECGDEFARQDHLVRHMQTHGSDKPFICPICGKQFNRRDSLARHERGHASKPTSSGHRTIYNRVSRACTNCSKSKIRCDGTQPCKNCLRKELECHHEVERKKKARRNNQGDKRDVVPALVPLDEDSALSGDDDQEPLEPNNNDIDRYDNASLGLADAHSTQMHSLLSASLALSPAFALDAHLSLDQSASNDPNYEQQNSHGHQLQAAPGIDLCQNSTVVPNVSTDTSQLQLHITCDATVADQQAEARPASPDLEDQAQPSTLEPWWRNNEEEDPVPPHGSTGSQAQLPDNTTRQSLEVFGTYDGASSYQLSPDFDMNDFNNWDPQFNITDWMIWELPDFQMLGDSASLEMSGRNGIDAQIHGRPADSLRVPQHSLAPAEPQVTGAGNTSAHGIGHSVVANERPAGKPPGIMSVKFPHFDSADSEILDAEDFGHVQPLSLATYEKIVENVKDACGGQHIAERMSISDLPSRRVLNCFLQLYFEYFHDLFPLVHQPTFSQTKSHWVQLLAMTAIGCRFSRTNVAGICAHAMSELVRVCVQYTIQVERSSIRTLWLTITLMLDEIGMMYGGDRRTLEMGFATGNVVTTQARRNNYFKDDTDIVYDAKAIQASEGKALEKHWLTWVRDETSRRVAYGIWILQCQLPLHFDLPSNMRLNEMLKPLPSSDILWAAPNSQSWRPLFIKELETVSKLTQPQNMNIILADVMVGKPIPSSISDFGYLALLHGLYQTTYELRSSLSNTLLADLLESNAGSERSLFSKWNCRADEILEQILHSARSHRELSLRRTHRLGWRLQLNVLITGYHVTLLNQCPVADLLMFVGSSSDSAKRGQAEAHLRLWISSHEGRTARNAVHHAAVLFTSIRQSPCQGFNESIAFLAATLTLWVYSNLTPAYIESASDSAVSQRKTIRLDDMYGKDNLKLWTAETSKTVRGYITDLGDLNGQGAGKRILSIAHKTMSEMPAWGLSRGFAAFLVSLKEQTGDRV